MRLKILLPCLLLCAGVARADVESAKTAITQLKDARAEKFAGALTGLNGQYKTALEAIQKRIMQSGDLDGAIAIKKEIDSLASPANAAALTLPDALGRKARTTLALKQSADFLEIRNKRAGELLAPFTADYKKSLEALLKKTVDDGDIDAALVVRDAIRAAGAFTPKSAFSATRWYNAHADGGPDTFIFNADGTFYELYHNHRKPSTWTDNPDGTCTVVMGGGHWNVGIAADNKDVLVRLSDQQRWAREAPGSPPAQTVDESEAPKKKPAPAKKPAGSDDPDDDKTPAPPAKKPGPSGDTPFGRRISPE